MDSYLSKTLNNVDRAMPFSNVLLQSADECLEQNINRSLVWHQCKFKKVIVADYTLDRAWKWLIRDTGRIF